MKKMSSVTEPSENEPVEPAESVEPEPGVQFMVEPEVNQVVNRGSHLFGLANWQKAQNLWHARSKDLQLRRIPFPRSGHARSRRGHVEF